MLVPENLQITASKGAIDIPKVKIFFNASAHHLLKQCTIAPGPTLPSEKLDQTRTAPVCKQLCHGPPTLNHIVVPDCLQWWVPPSTRSTVPPVHHCTQTRRPGPLFPPAPRIDALPLVRFPTFGPAISPGLYCPRLPSTGASPLVRFPTPAISPGLRCPSPLLPPLPASGLRLLSGSRRPSPLLLLDSNARASPIVWFLSPGLAIAPGSRHQDFTTLATLRPAIAPSSRCWGFTSCSIPGARVCYHPSPPVPGLRLPPNYRGPVSPPSLSAWADISYGSRYQPTYYYAWLLTLGMLSPPAPGTRIHKNSPHMDY
ncbi:unnamed protein product [Linum trigynum]|uniref:Uncharacterized protein n=1 Tax=Linum trigynum TaxID=586398 RepID=A0AAV2E5R2_9ROSI